MVVTEPLGPKIRRQRRRLGLTLDELAGRTSISKPYLSLIETGRVVNPPSDEKLRRLEQTLGFSTGELLTQAHLQRTPRDVRAVLHQLMSAEAGDGAALDPANLSGVMREHVSRSGVGAQAAASAVPIINRVAAAYPQDFVDAGYPARVAEEYVSCPDVNDAGAFAARVQGDSMTPKYRPGDIVIFSPALSPRDGDDCFIRFADGQTTFRRIFFESGETGQPQLRLQPRNERHRPQMVLSQTVAGMYKAVYRYQKVDED